MATEIAGKSRSNGLLIRADAAGGNRCTCGTQIFCLGPEINGSLPPSKGSQGFAWLLEIVVGEEAAVVVAFKPMIEMDLIKVGCNNLFPEFVGLAA